MIMELEDKDERTFEDFLAFLQLHPELKTWEIGPEPILSLPGLQIYPDRRKIYHGQQEIELNTKEFALLCLLVTNKGRVLTYGQMYEKVWKEEPFGNEHIAVGSHVRSMRQKLYAIYPKPPFVISCIRDIRHSDSQHRVISLDAAEICGVIFIRFLIGSLLQILYRFEVVHDWLGRAI